MKNLSKVLALVLVVAMVFSLAVSAGAAPSYKDSASVNYDEAVQLLTALKINEGYDTDGDGKGDTFKPGQPITRAEITIMLSYMVANADAKYGFYNDKTKLNNDYKSLCTFADAKNHYAAGFIAYCYGNGYISGRDANTFDPEGNVTIAETAVMLLRAMGYNASIEQFGTGAGTLNGYNLQLAARTAGLLDGMNDVEFFAVATREQVAQLFMNALDGFRVSYNVAGVRSYAATYNYTINGTTISDYQRLVHTCFQHVVKVNTTNAYGLAGHQWVTYANAVETKDIANNTVVTYTGAVGQLTDVYVDDAVLATFKGGTSYASIAASLGLTSATSTVPSVVYINGATGTNLPASYGLPGSGNLNDLIDAAYKTGSTFEKNLPDNCTLSIVRDYDRSVGGTYYKMMYYYEFVALVGQPTLVDYKYSPRYGQYQFPVVYYKNGTAYDDEVVYAATKDAYAVNTYYIVVPNESNIASGSNFPNQAEYNAFLSIAPAKTASFTALDGKVKDFTSSLNTYIKNGATTYNVSKNITNFAGTDADYGKAIGLVFNTAGYVAAYTKLAPADSGESYGYVYVDSLMVRETMYFGENPYYTATYSWQPEAKAQVYFPSASGNNTPEVINLAVNLRTKTVAAKTTNWGEFTPDEDDYVNANNIQLKGTQSKAFLDTTNKEYEWNAGLSNVRLYNEWFDGWYFFTKYADGTYALEPVAQEQVGIEKGNANVVADETTDTYDGYKLTSTTEVYTFEMDLATMTASVAVQTAYKGIATGVYGNDTGAYEEDVFGDEYTMPYTGIVGGKVTAKVDTTNNTGIITKVEEFATVRAENKYSYTLYKGTTDYSSTYGYGLKFLAGGAAEILYLAENVTIIGARAESKPAADALAWIGRNADDNCFELYLDPTTGLIVQVRRIELTKAENIYAVDANGYIWETSASLAKNYNTAAVWNFTNGAADAPAKGDTVYYVAGATIPVMWVSTPGADVFDGNPSWNTPNVGNQFPWWN